MQQNTHATKTGPRRHDTGAVLITVMLVMMGLLGMGIMALWMTTGNLQIGANSNLRAQALYVAEMGIERVRADLNGPTPRDVTALLTGNSPLTTTYPAPSSIDSNGLPNTIGVIYRDSSGVDLTQIDFPPANFNRSSEGSSQFMGRYTVWIRNDTAECRQGNYLTDPNNTVVIRSQGEAPDGRTRVVLEVTMGPGAAGTTGAGGTGGNPPVLCNSGKNACDDNNSVQNGIVVQ